MKIDAHQHFWKLDRGDYHWLTPDLQQLYRDFLPRDLEPLLRECGIEGTIAVQAAESEAETEFLLSLADRYDWIVGVVGWVDMEASDAPASIERLARHPKLVGLRPMIQSIDDDAWMLRKNLRPAIASMIDNNLTFDALVLPRHLENLGIFVARYGQLSVVIDHCAKPEIRTGSFQPWASNIAAFSGSSNVYCKVSGLVTEASADWTVENLAPYIDHVKQVFGASRIMFGSDWPVVNLASDYKRWNDVARSIALTGAKKDENAFMTTTAQRAYSRIKLRA